MWTFLPDVWLTAIGFSYLPHKSVFYHLSWHSTCLCLLYRYWAIAVPSFIIVSTLVGVVMYACMMVVSFTDPRSLQGMNTIIFASCPGMAGRILSYNTHKCP